MRRSCLLGRVLILTKARGRAWLVAAALATPLGIYFAVRGATSPNSSLSYLFASVPLLFVARAAARSPSSWALTGVIVGVSVLGVSGIGVLLIPLAVAGLVLEARDRASVLTFARVGVIAFAFIATIAAVIAAGTLLYRGE